MVDQLVREHVPGLVYLQRLEGVIATAVGAEISHLGVVVES